MMKRLIFLLLAAFGAAGAAQAQDLIVCLDTSTILSKVVEIDAENVKYKKFSNLEGPTYVLPRAEVVYIRYQNGERDILSPEAYARLEASDVEKALSLDPTQPVYEPGDYYARDGVEGIVIQVDGTGQHGLLMSMDEANVRWSEIRKSEAPLLGLREENDGAANQRRMEELVAEGRAKWEDYPAFAWCRAKGEGWYLPAINEVLLIGNAYNDGRTRFNRKARRAFNAEIDARGGVKLDKIMYYYSSTEKDARTAYVSHMGIEQPLALTITKNTSFLVRAVRRF